MVLVLVILRVGLALRLITAVRGVVVGLGVGRFACEVLMGRVLRDEN